MKDFGFVLMVFSLLLLFAGVVALFVDVRYATSCFIGSFVSLSWVKLIRDVEIGK